MLILRLQVGFSAAAALYKSTFASLSAYSSSSSSCISDTLPLKLKHYSFSSSRDFSSSSASITNSDHKTQSNSSSSSSTPPIRIVLLGAPGVGKGTYAKYVAPSYQIPSISTGDLVRAEIKSGSALGASIKQATNSGQLLGDDVVLSLLRQRLSKDDCAQGGFLLDGYPRRLSQAQSLQSIAPINLVLSLNLRRDILIYKLSERRVCSKCGHNYNYADIQEEEYKMPPLLPQKANICDSCGGHNTIIQRADDRKEVVEDRLRIYEQETLPLVDYYRQQQILIDFDVKKGVQDVPRLLQDLDAAFKRLGINKQQTQIPIKSKA